MLFWLLLLFREKIILEINELTSANIFHAKKLFPKYTKKVTKFGLEVLQNDFKYKKNSQLLLKKFTRKS